MGKHGLLLAAILCIPVARAGADAAAPAPFPDFGFLPAPGAYNGAVFKLSQEYPTAKPRKVPEFFKQLPKKFTPNFDDWRGYMLAVRSYCFEGNTTTEFRVENNTVRPWYHIPWQHYGPAGREGVHGLTREAPVQPKQLALTQGQPTAGQHYQTYAVGFFNDMGGYGIGRVWANRLAPNSVATNKPAGFPDGTVICKLLFVDVPVSQVPSLANPVQWQAYMQATYENTQRSLKTATLIQMDIAVKDKRAPNGWLFGTFQYNGALNNSDRWNNLIPVGMQWGNDPTITDDTYTNPTPTVTKINPNLKETSINPNTSELPPTHLGWNGRLNGPVDNPRSACMSCHMTAESPTLSPLSPLFEPNPPPVGSKEWMRWFQNVPCGVPFDKGAQSNDYSLQLSGGIANFEAWREAQAGLFASSYAPPPKAGAEAVAATPAAPNLTTGKPKLKAAAPGEAPKKVYPVVRDVSPEAVK